MTSVRTWLTVGVLSLLAAGEITTADAGDAGDAGDAATFARLFVEEKYDDLMPRMSAQMQSGFGPAAAALVRAQFITTHGAWKSMGDAWLEDTVSGYQRYRVPVTFERATIDLRIVFDGDGKVAGFFHAPHLPPPDDASSPAAKPRPDVAGHWEGTIDIPGAALTVLIDLRQKDGNWTGSCDVPVQSVKGLSLENVRVDGDAVTFSLSGIPGTPTFDGTLSDKRITGTFTQSGQKFPFSLTRKKRTEPLRPQEPKPPYPYEADDVHYTNGDIEIAGTLTLPRGDGPFAVVLLITGSGAQDRNEEVFKHKPFLVIADHLTRAGIAVLRVDDRGVGKTSGSLSTATTADLAGDAAAGVRYLTALSSIDPKRIGVAGHSEGGVIAPIVAARMDDVAFVIMLAGTGVPGDELLVRQLELIMRASGATDAQVGPIVAAQAKLLGLVTDGASADAIHAQARELVRAQAAAAPQPQMPTDAQLDAGAAAVASKLLTPWIRYFIAYDPREALRNVHVPVLAINGELDLQVDPKQNLPAIRAALEQAGNRDVTIRELKGLNHLFQPATTGAIGEYYEIEETFDVATLDLIRDWILERFGDP